MSVLAGLIRSADHEYTLKPQHAIDEFYESMLQWFDSPNADIDNDYIKFIATPMGASVFLGSWNFEMIDSALTKFLQGNGHKMAFKLPKGVKVKDFRQGFAIQADGTMLIYKTGAVAQPVPNF